MTLLGRYTACEEFLSWKELMMLGKALGYSESIFRAFEEIFTGKTGVEKANVDLFFNSLIVQQTFIEYEVHQDPHSITETLKTAISLILGRKLTFEEIHDSRVAFYFYVEDSSTNCIFANEKSILNSLRLCKRIAAPLWVARIVKKYRSNGRERITLLEFLKIASQCRPEKDVPIIEGIGIGKDERNLYILCDFEKLFHCFEDQKLMRLDFEYTKAQEEEKMKNSKEAKLKEVQEAIERRNKENKYKNSEDSSFQICREKYYIFMKEQQERQQDKLKLMRIAARKFQKKMPASLPATRVGSAMGAHKSFPRPFSAFPLRGGDSRSSGQGSTSTSLFDESSSQTNSSQKTEFLKPLTKPPNQPARPSTAKVPSKNVVPAKKPARPHSAFPLQTRKKSLQTTGENLFGGGRSHTLQETSASLHPYLSTFHQNPPMAAHSARLKA